MDDLTVLQAVRAAEPGPSAAETTAARNALLTAIEAAGRTSPGRGAARPRPRLRPAARRTADRRVWVPVMAAAATVAVGASALMLAPGGSHHAASWATLPRQTAHGTTSHQVGPVSPVYKSATFTAAFVLHKAAAAAAVQADATGKYFFSESEWVSSLLTASPKVYRVGPYLRRTWFGNGADGKVVLAVGGAQRDVGPSSDSGLTWAQLQALPTGQAKLLGIVARLAMGLNPKYPNSSAFSEFEIIGQLLIDGPISPSVQAALYQAAAGLPGIKVIDTTDLVGRSAVELYMEPGPDDPPTVGHALYFSPDTFQLLGEATISAASVSCPVLWSSAIVATGYVSSDTQLPTGTPTKLERAYYSNSEPGCSSLVQIPAAIGLSRQLGSWLLAQRRDHH